VAGLDTKDTPWGIFKTWYNTLAGQNQEGREAGGTSEGESHGCWWRAGREHTGVR